MQLSSWNFSYHCLQWKSALMHTLYNPNCAECQIDPSVCTRCQNGFSTINNICVCVENTQLLIKLNCMTWCAQCNNGTVFISCTTGYILSAGTCQLNYLVGTFNVVINVSSVYFRTQFRAARKIKTKLRWSGIIKVWSTSIKIKVENVRYWKESQLIDLSIFKFTTIN